ncbi:hypothetical protein [Bradyrhizobium sp. URHD0069]|uniref:hypothetical protein n=1 Tax=Bradyrhizobium sp. URHD0069 TaxID=1380355 RepID=UPI000A4917AA|nr:hypothetical protein [Bradyrhizobium sp. URHD0069]
MQVKVEEIFHILRTETPRPEAQRLAIKLLEQAMTMARGTPASFHSQMTDLKSTIGVLRSMNDSNTVYWTPPCLLFIGMRLNEFARLRTSDLIEHNGRPHLGVVCVQDPDEDDDLSPGTVPAQVPDDRRVKSVSARRFIHS